MEFPITLVQNNPRLGDLHANLNDHLSAIDAAAEEGSSLVAFPELSLTGYFLKDQVAELGLELDSEVFDQLLSRSERITIGVGFVERSRDGRAYNAYAILEEGRVLGVHRKVHLVSYGLFDEARDFAAGESFEIIESKLGRIGPLICEDAWHVGGGYLHFLNDADLLLVPSASPARGVEASGDGLGSVATWNTLLCANATLFRTWIAYISRVGWEDGIGFGGGSAVIDPFGQVNASLGGLEVGSLSTTIDRSALLRSRTEIPLRRDERPGILAAGLLDHVPLLRGADSDGERS